jgi:hypothetical protein
MKRSIQLSIASPCSQRWQDFAVTSTGGFCGSCNKTVVDFTRMSDDEIVQFFESRPAHTCGRFAPGQLKEYLTWEPEKLRPGKGLLVAGMMSLLLVMVGRPAQTQNLVEPQKVETPLSVVQNDHSLATAGYYVVRGFVRSREDDSVLPGVNVVLKGTTVSTITDAEGWFQFPVELQENDILIFSFIGLETAEHVVPRKGNKDFILNIALSLDVTVLGEVAVNEPYVPKKSGLAAVWSMMTRWF